MGTTPEPINDLNGLEIRRHRRVWQPFMDKYNCQYICEVGVFTSQNFKRMIQHNPKVAIGVDNWREDGNPGRNDSGFSQEKLDEQAEYFKKLVSAYPFVHLNRQLTADAAENYPNEYFDLIYIDADHSYEGVKADLNAWYPKMKPGRFFTGDDYSNSHAPVVGLKFGVIKAVNEFAHHHRLEVHKLTKNGWCIIKPLK